MLVRTFSGGIFGSNTHVVSFEGSTEGLVIDPSGGVREAMAYVAAAGIKLRRIIYTHAHPDHISGAAEFKRATGAAIAGHQRCAGLLRSGMMKAASGFGLIFKPLAPEDILEDGEVIEAGGIGFKTLHTPGHTPDGISVAGGGAVFTGDLLMAGGVGRTDIPGGSHEALLSSIRDRILTLDDDTAVYPGHGPATTVGIERRTNPWLACFR